MLFLWFFNYFEIIFYLTIDNKDLIKNHFLKKKKIIMRLLFEHMCSIFIFFNVSSFSAFKKYFLILIDTFASINVYMYRSITYIVMLIVIISVI